MQLHVISDGKKQVDELVNIFTSIHPHVDYMHLREKHKTASELVSIVEKLLAQGVPSQKIIINDRLDVAHSMNLKGAQLAYHSVDIKLARKAFPNLLLGCSIHSLEEAIYAEQNGADYLLFGHIYETTSKQGKIPKGLAQLKKIINNVSIPVISIGGIIPENVKDIHDLGGSGVAIMSGIVSAEDVVEAAKTYQTSTLVR
ncbi:thiazole tautomerase TenI [Bacillus sp. FJAT-45066]|uniref:thiazole tautomerase TenI n=1 Tax=Bacillus sp. FJAT-45066 TaxID=2011010 RepID=UPI000BB7DD9D|nr:thiazole tautomerase TenI [Bacillus sp. FJAT-45066]